MSSRVVVIDDHTVFAQMLALALTGQPDLECVGHAQTVLDGVSLVEEMRPDLVVMDVRLADGDGIAAAAELTEAHLGLRVVVLTAEVDDRLMRRAAQAGACALLLKDGDLGDLLAVLRTARSGDFVVHPTVLRRLVSSPVPQQRIPPLTPREQDVLQLLAAGLEARVIASEMGISVNTCRGYIKGLLTKLGAHSQLEAVTTAMRHGLIRDRSSR